MLAGTTPAHFVGFDLLALGQDDLTGAPFGERRARLVGALDGVGGQVHLTPATAEMAVAADWFETFEGAGLDGVVAKALDLPYLPDKRAMFKVKHDRTADCVVAGFRWHKTGGGKVGSLLLGLHDSAGALHHVGVTSSFTEARRLELADEVAPYRMGSMEGHPWDRVEPAESTSPAGDGTRRPGGPSRWNAGKDLSFEPLRPELVCEVGYDHMEGSRFRHTAQFKRWRPDRDPRSCAYDQLDRPLRFDLADILGTVTS
jgi:ATP-dependent DNA ligase